MTKTGTLSIVIVALVTLCVLPLAAHQPQSTPPLTNGRITFSEINGDGLTANVFVADADGSNVQQVALANPAESFGIPIWSPDGNHLLISHTVRFDSSGNFLFQPATVNPDGSGFNQLVPPDPPGASSQGMDCGTWSRDGTRLLCGFDGGQSPGVFSIRASDGGDPVRLTTYPFGSNCAACDYPDDVSLVSGQFVFMRFRGGLVSTPGDVTAQVAIYVENLDGTGLRQITPYGVALPHERASAKFSPDGTLIISTLTNGQLFTVRSDGTDLTTIKLQVGTQQYFAFQPHWSPDGTRIIFVMFINGGFGIYTANPDGSHVTLISTDPSVLYNSPDWGVNPV